MKKRIFAVAAVKGGTGKTVTAATLAQAAAMDGKRVLAIDLDTQTTLSFWLNARDTGKTAYNIFMNGDASGSIQKTASGIDLIPGSGNLIAVKTGPNSARRLETALKPIQKNYDYIFIDTGPAISELLFNAVFASTDIIIPMNAELHSIRGMLAVIDIVNQARDEKAGIRYAGAMITDYDRRPIISQELRDTAKDYCKENKVPYLGEIRHTVKVKEALAAQELLLSYAPNCTAAIDYLSIYRKITGKKAGQ